MDEGLELLGGGAATRKQVDPMALQDVLMVVSNGQVALRRIPFGLD